MKIDSNIVKKILTLAAIIEAVTGLALMIVPALVVQLLLGAEISGVGVPLGRCFGIALLALALACLPGRQRREAAAPAVRAMWTYNALLAAYLTYLGTAGHLGGLLLWPAVALHAGMAIAIAWYSRYRS